MVGTTEGTGSLRYLFDDYGIDTDLRELGGAERCEKLAEDA